MNGKIVLMNEWMNGVHSWVCECGMHRSWALGSKERGDSRGKEKYERRRDQTVLELWQLCRNNPGFFVYSSHLFRAQRITVLLSQT